MFAQVIYLETEWRAVDIKRVDAVLSDCARFIVAILFLTHILHFFFRNLCGVLASGKGEGTTRYVLMGFIVLQSTNSSNTGLSSEFDEYISL